jgi:hypothetical protein
MNNNDTESSELSSHDGTRRHFNGSKAVIKLGIDVHQDFYVVVMQEGGTNPKPAQRFQKDCGLLCDRDGEVDSRGETSRNLVGSAQAPKFRFTM